MVGVLALPDATWAMVYKTPAGTLKDNFVIWHEGKYYLVAMYREQVAGGEEHWNDMWLATSTDGVHWKDVGPVIHDAPFIVYSMAVHKVGNRFILNHGSLTGPNVDVVRFWESDDLVHWKYLGKEYDARRPDGKRLDSMDVISVERDGRTQWFGYATGGLFRSDDGVRWKWQEDYRLSDNNWDVGETGGCACWAASTTCLAETTHCSAARPWDCRATPVMTYSRSCRRNQRGRFGPITRRCGSPGIPAASPLRSGRDSVGRRKTRC